MLYDLILSFFIIKIVSALTDDSYRVMVRFCYILSSVVS